MPTIVGIIVSVMSQVTSSGAPVGGTFDFLDGNDFAFLSGTFFDFLS